LQSHSDLKEKPGQKFAPWFLQTTGYLPWILLAAIIVAAVAHHVSRLPPEYTWLQPLRILRNVVRREWFPTLVLGALVFGWAARVNWRQLARGAPAVFRRRVALRPAVAAVGSASASVGVVLALSGAHNAIDFACAAVVGGALSLTRRPLQVVRRSAVDLAVVALLFVGCSYVFTVIKALLFTVGEIEDTVLISLEERIFGTALHRPVAAWAAQTPWLVKAFDDIYFRLFEHMTLTSVFLVGAGLHRERTSTADQKFVPVSCPVMEMKSRDRVLNGREGPGQQSGTSST
jgi:hypothetical protein